MSSKTYTLPNSHFYHAALTGNMGLAKDCLDAIREWLQWGWPVVRRNKRLLDRLLARSRFEMAFKVRYAG